MALGRNLTTILGLNTFHADSSAALVRDGRLILAVAEERLNRIKHFAGFPRLSIQEALRTLNADLDGIEHLAIARDSKANLLSKLSFAARNIANLPNLAKQRLEN